MAVVTQKHARKIARKLDGAIEPGRKHDKVEIPYKGKIIIRYGISRASRNKPQNHVSDNLGISIEDTLRLASCSISKESFFQAWENATKD